MTSTFFIGKHLICEAYGIDEDVLKDEKLLKDILIRAAEATGSTVLGSFFHKFGGGEGVTGVVVIAESHVSIHTWPEHGYAAIDIFTCGNHIDPWKGLEIIRTSLKPVRIHTSELSRGLIEEEASVVR
jgi:S-adenosylmethionine decarboxylase